MNDIVLQVINTVRANNGLQSLATLPIPGNLRKDLGLSSIDLAELTVRLEDATGIDVFADGIVGTVEEILEKLKRG